MIPYVALPPTGVVTCRFEAPQLRGPGLGGDDELNISHDRRSGGAVAVVAANVGTDAAPRLRSAVSGAWPQGLVRSGGLGGVVGQPLGSLDDRARRGDGSRPMTAPVDGLPPGSTVELDGAVVLIVPPGGPRHRLRAVLTHDPGLDWPDDVGWRLAAAVLREGGSARLTFADEGAARTCAARLRRLPPGRAP